jgi:hypothetical protein
MVFDILGPPQPRSNREAKDEREDVVANERE